MFKQSSAKKNPDQKMVRKKNRTSDTNSRRYTIAQFPFGEGNISSFGRNKPRPRDCTINAMEMLNLIDQKNADLMRIMVGDTGLTETILKDCLTYLCGDYGWKLENYTNIDTLEKIINEDLETNHAIFCGYDDAHVFLIAKNHNNEIFVIDPQLKTKYYMCDITDATCYNYIKGKGKYHIIKRHL